MSERLSATESRALDAILELADGHPDRAVSVRQLATRLEVTTSTAWWHRDRLVRKGYIRLVPRGPREASGVRPTRQRRPDVAYGTCSACDLERPLDAAGRIPHHEHARRTCPGAGLAPKAAA